MISNKKGNSKHPLHTPLSDHVMVSQHSNINEGKGEVLNSEIERQKEWYDSWGKQLDPRGMKQVL